MITAKEARELLSYDKDTGVLSWNFRGDQKFDNRFAGTNAGYLDSKSGYVRVSIKEKNYLAHRLIWLMETGAFPIGSIDHIDRNRSNNRISNLREATRSQNAANVDNRKKSRLTGASFHKLKKRWAAQITIMKKAHHLGYFATEIEAHEAYVRAAILAFGEFSPFTNSARKS